ncbi:MAG: helix-turn-helix domain-containing protein [Candidatus Rokuibacteriota bacterium]
MKQAKALSAILGRGLRQLRESRGLRQDEVATLARRWGLEWTQATVATIETGRRQLSVEEFLLLPWIAAHQGIDAIAQGTATPIELEELIRRGAGEDAIALTPTVYAEAGGIRAIVRGQAHSPGFEDWFALGQSRLRVSEEVLAWGQRMPHFHVLAAHADQWADAEQKAARRLATSSLAVAVLARRLWKRSLTEERDARVAGQAPAGATAQTLRALRGHVARALLDELRKEGIERWKPRASARTGRAKR